MSQEFEKSGDSEKHLQELLQLTTYGVARGKVLSRCMTSASTPCCLEYNYICGFSPKLATEALLILTSF